MKLNWKQWFRNKQNHMLVKLVVAILLMGLAFRLVFFRSTRLSPVLEETPFAEKTVLPEETPFADCASKATSCSNICFCASSRKWRSGT